MATVRDAVLHRNLKQAQQSAAQNEKERAAYDAKTFLGKAFHPSKPHLRAPRDRLEEPVRAAAQTADGTDGDVPELADVKDTAVAEKLAADASSETKADALAPVADEAASEKAPEGEADEENAAKEGATLAAAEVSAATTARTVENDASLHESHSEEGEQIAAESKTEEPAAVEAPAAEDAAADTPQPMLNLDKKSVEDVELSGKRVLIRVDFNVPMDKDGNITNNQRILGAIPTIKLCLDRGAKAVILMSHMGRPFGVANDAMSLRPVATRLAQLLEREVSFLKECVGDEVEAACADPIEGSVILLENLRFHVEEEGKGTVDGTKDGEKVKASKEEVAAFRGSLSKLGDVYVCDAFGTVHRGHSSMVGVDLPVKVAGLLVLKELQAFSKVVAAPQKPLLAIVGGAKVSDKIKLIDSLVSKADSIIICGGMAFTFLKVCFGMKIGKSLFDEGGAEIVQSILDKAKANGVEVVLPTDFLCGQEFKNDQETILATQEDGIPDEWLGLDCGPASMKLFADKVATSKTVVWNGPAGVFEFDNFAKGTKAILDAVAALHATGGVGIIGGGDSATAAANAGMEDKVTFVSTGGGASLELLQGELLPGILNLQDK